MKKVIEASEAIAQGVMLCKPAVIPMYPITPQTHIVERLADYIFDGKLNSEVIHAESEHSAISAAIGASATGVRTFTATASQGLALMHEILFVASGMRLPIVMAIANRTLSAPINIWNDHQDSMSARDSGWIQLYVESSQEALDTIIMAYKIAEQRDVLLPAMVCLDGYNLSHVYEIVDIPEQNKVNKFLPRYKPLYKLDPAKPLTMGPVGFPDTFMEFRAMQHDAMGNAMKAIIKVNKEFRKTFGRGYGNGLIELYRMEDARYALMTMGTVSGTAKVVIDSFRKKGKKVGLIKLKCLRPFPSSEIIESCERLKGLAVIDRSISPGYGGPLYSEVHSTVAEKKIVVNSFIAGLGGRDVTQQHLAKALNMLNKKRSTEWLG
mgnify:CR=1 FL=1